MLKSVLERTNGSKDRGFENPFPLSVSSIVLSESLAEGFTIQSELEARFNPLCRSSLPTLNQNYMKMEQCRLATETKNFRTAAGQYAEGLLRYGILEYTIEGVVLAFTAGDLWAKDAGRADMAQRTIKHGATKGDGQMTLQAVCDKIKVVTTNALGIGRLLETADKFNKPYLGLARLARLELSGEWAGWIAKITPDTKRFEAAAEADLEERAEKLKLAEERAENAAATA